MSNGIFGIIEAEDFTLVSNAKIATNGAASNSRIVEALQGGAVKISTTIDAQPGTYDFRLAYFDENDDVSSITVKIDGVTVGSWAWNKYLGSAYATPDTLTSYTIQDVKIGERSTITIEGVAARNELLRLDRVDLLPQHGALGAADIPSFEGAEGFGAVTAGGRGGWIVKVTNLNDSGVGSLRWALEGLEAPRIVVFDVGGVIDLKSEIRVNGDVTVAGQTAPGEGVTIRGSRLRVVEDDVIIQGLKFRPGDGAGMAPEERDGISVGTSGHTVRRVVIDSNSMTWAIDENVTVWSGARDVTISNNIVAEGLYNSRHPSGDHSMGILIGDGAQRISVIDNLIAHNMFRNPQLISATQVEMINNLVYNYGDTGLEIPAGTLAGTTVNAIGNHFIAGPNSSARAPIRLNETENGTLYYLRDNLTPTRTSSSQPERDAAGGDGLSVLKSSPVFAGSGVDVMAASAVKNYVLSHAGARVGGALDAIDARIVDSVQKLTGRIIDSPSQVGGYITASTRTTLADTDKDGIPDVHETALGFDPRKFDAHGDRDKDGYTNIEEYIGSLLGGGGGSGGSTETPRALTVEAESFVLRQGFAVEQHVIPSGGKFIRATGSGEQRAELTFTGATGEYDLRLHYADENDGAARLRILVDGVQMDSWTFNKELGSAYVERRTMTSHLTDGLSLTKGDVITFVGIEDGGEPVRLDYVELTPVDSLL